MDSKVKIPKGLALATLMSKKLRKAFTVFLPLKTWCDSGLATREDIGRLDVFLGVHHKTVMSRLQLAIDAGIITVEITEGGQRQYRLCSYDHLASLAGIPGWHYKRFYYVTYDKIPNLEYYLIVLAIREKKETMRYKFYANIKRYRLEHELREILGVQGNRSLREAVKMGQFEALIEGLAIYDENEWALLMAFNPYEEVSYRRWTAYMGYTSRGAFAYIKRKLQGYGLVSITKREHSIPHGILTDQEARKTVLGVVHSSRPDRCLKLRQPDAIAPLA